MFDEQNKSFGQIKSQNEVINVNDLPIRTMESDLENPNLPNDFVPERKMAQETFSPNQKPQMTEKQKTSPFLNTGNNLSGDPKITETEKNESPETENHPLNFSKMSIIAIIVFILIVSGFSGYYFLATRNSTENETATIVNKPDDVPALNEDKTLKETTTNGINPDKPNFLIINSANPSVLEAQTALKNKFTEVIDIKSEKPIEFIPTDENFTPLSIDDFQAKLSLSLPTTILSNLSSGISIFMDQNGLALVFNVTDQIKLETALKQEQKKLISSLESLFWDTKVEAFSGSEFSSNVYKNTFNINYLNLKEGGSLALDYIVTNNKLIFATSKQTALDLIDFLEDSLIPKIQ